MRFSSSHLLVLAFPHFASAFFADQDVLLPPTLMPQEPSPDSLFTPITTTKPSLTDLLTIESTASIYFSYARDTEYSKEFSVLDHQWTLLVPTNKAVMALPRKPHQGLPSATTDSAVEMTEEQYDRQSRNNVERWVAAHIIPFRISLSDAPVTYDTLLDGTSVTFSPAPVHVSSSGKPSLLSSPAEWSRVVVEGDIRIVGMKEGENGVIYMIDGTIQPK